MSRANSITNFNKNSNKDLSTWEWDDVSNWLQSNSMGQYIEVFQKHETNGYDLCYLTNEDLSEMRLTNFHDRNLILKNIRLMIIEQLKIVINFQERLISIQLDFDPNFTTEMLINSLLDLFKIQGTLIYIITNENEILMPNIKIIDLILLNPKKYKYLKILTTYEEYTYTQNNKNLKEKKFDRNDDQLNPNINNLNDFYGNYDNTRLKKSDPQLQNQNLYDNNLNSNLSSTPFVPIDNTEREKEPINSTGFSSVLKQDRDLNSNDYSKYSNYNQNKNSFPKDKDDLINQKNLDEYSYANTTKKSSSEIDHYKNDNYSNYKSNPSNLEGDFNKFSSKNYESTLNNIASSGSANKFNTNKNKNSNNADYEDKIKIKNLPSTSYERLLIKDRDKSGYLEEMELSGTLQKNNFSSDSEFNYEKNNQLKTFGSDYKHEFKTELRPELKTPSEDNKLSNLNSINSFDNFRDKEQLSNKGDGGLGMTGKYNYSERIKEDMNRQRFASEKRSYRNTSYDNKNEDKSDDRDFSQFKKNDLNNFEKFSFRYGNNNQGNTSSEKNSVYNEAEIRDKEKDNYSNTKDNTPNNTIQTENKPRMGSIRSTLNSYNSNTINNIIANGKGESFYKFSTNREAPNFNTGKNFDAETEKDTKKQIRQVSSTYSKKQQI